MICLLVCMFYCVPHQLELPNNASDKSLINALMSLPFACLIYLKILMKRINEILTKHII